MNLDLLPNEEAAKADVESGLYEAHYQPREGDTVLDLGAHVGYWSERALKLVGDIGTVVAFEPDPINYQRLVARIGGRKNVYTVNAGVANSTNRLPFYRSASNSGAHSFTRSESVAYSHAARLIDIGHWLKTFALVPMFVKIDTEGMEPMILTSLFFAGLRPEIAFECHSYDDYAEIRQIAKTNQYHLLPEQVTVGVCYLVK